MAEQQQKFLAHGLEAGSPRSGQQRDQVGAFFQVVDFLVYPHVMGGAKDLSGAFYKSSNPTHKGSPLMT